MTDAPPFVVEEPGVYLGLSDADYHRDAVPGGSLSSTGARKLLPPSCPALYRYWADNPQPRKAHFDFGKAAHRYVLGDGPEVVVVQAADWRSKAAREQRDEAHANGAVPLLEADYERVLAMARVLREHPLAGKLLQPGTGHPEASLFWQDPETGVWCRARPDWLPHAHGGLLVVPDYKTTDSVAPEDVERAVYKFGYHVQDAFYSRGIRALGLAERLAFVFIFQMKEPPYLVEVYRTDDIAKRIGEHQVREALHLYRDCTTAGHWPSFHDDVATVSLPRWVESQYAQEIMR